MKQEGTLTQRLLQQAHDAFRERCCSHPPALRELFEEAVQIARQVSEPLAPEQVLLLLQEHPDWIHAQADMPGRTCVAGIVAEQLAYLMRYNLNERWAALLLNHVSHGVQAER